LPFSPFVFYAPPPPKTYTLSLHDALPICLVDDPLSAVVGGQISDGDHGLASRPFNVSRDALRFCLIASMDDDGRAFLRQSLRNADRKSTRLNSSHVAISYAVFCLKKKNKI